jgi:HD-GYP domain-containing protein (c-di-GMP phosphodiesterase class II)
MSSALQHRLGSILNRSLCDLINEISKMAGAPMAVLDFGGDTVFATDGWPDGYTFDLEQTPKECSVPVEVSKTIVGRLVAQPCGQDVEPVLRSLAVQIAEQHDLENGLREMTEQLSRSYDEISLVYRIAGLIDPHEDLSSNVLRTIGETSELLENRFLAVVIPADECVLWRASPGMSVPDSLVWLSGEDSKVESIYEELQLANPALNPTLNSRSQGAIRTPYGKVEYTAIPILVRSGIVGFAGLFRSAAERAFGTGEVKLVESLVHQLSTAATNKLLNRELFELVFDVMRSLVAAIEAKDEYTSGHSERVYRLSILIGKAMNLSKNDLRTLSWAALLHDIGKIAISGLVLRKPEALSVEEYESIKTHPARGCRVLEPLRPLSGILPGIRHHHERYDGKGYPDQLAGKNIPLMARVICLADSFDAMVSARPNRPAGSVEHALDEIRSGAGSQFDPDIAKLFLEMAKRGGLTPDDESVLHQGQVEGSDQPGDDLGFLTNEHADTAGNCSIQQKKTA